MKKIKFIKAGTFRDSDKVFLTSRNRRYKNQTEFHRNDFQTEFIFPYEFFRKNFKYNKLLGIYENSLTMQDVRPYTIKTDSL